MAAVKILKRQQFNMIFFTEMWERFAFYGLQSIFMLFIVSGHLPKTIKPYMVFGIFNAVLYVMPTIGGYAADRYFGIKRSLILGAILLSLGYGLLAWVSDYEAILVALAFVAIGNGFFKPTPSALIAQLAYGSATESKRMFALYYMSINLGSIPALIFIPKIAMHYSYHVAFFLSMLGMLVGLGNFLYRISLFKSLQDEAGSRPFSGLLGLGMLGFIVVCLVVNVILLHYANIAFYLVLGAGIAVLGFLFSLNKHNESLQARFKHVIGILLIVETIVFWIVYNQIFSTVLLFAKHNVNLILFGFKLSPGNLAVFDTLAILALSPVIAAFYNLLKKKKWKLTIPYKFALGVIFSGLSVLVIVLACILFATDNQINLFWIGLSLTVFAVGELLVSALGLSMVSLYFPKKINTFAMGIFFITVAIGSVLTGKLAQLFVSIPENISSGKSLVIYTQYFTWLGVGAVGLGLFYVLLAYLIGLRAKQKGIVLD